MSVISGIVGASASKSAASTQADAATQAAQTSSEASRYAADIQKQMYDQARTDQTPWRQAGVNALGQLNTGTAAGGQFMRPFAMSDYQADPGYAFRLSEGMKGLQNSAAARGNLLSGATLKGITRFGQDSASQEYQNAYNRYNTNVGTQYNRLASMAGLGQTANAALGAAGSTYGNNASNIAMSNAGNVGNMQLAAGQANASAYQGYGKAASNALSGVGDYYKANSNDLGTYAGEANAWMQNLWA